MHELISFELFCKQEIISFKIFVHSWQMKIHAFNLISFVTFLVENEKLIFANDE